MQPIKIQLPKPHSGQQEVLKAINIDKFRFVVLCCGRRWGKSLIAKSICLERILKGESVGYVTPTYDLADEFYDELIDLIPQSLLATGTNKSRYKIKLVNGGKLQFITGERLDTNFRGKHFHYLVIDEAAKIEDLKKQWLTSIRYTLADYRGGCLFVSTPRGKDYFYSLYQKGVNGDNGYKSFHFTTYDNPYISNEELDEIKADSDEAQFRQETLAIALENQDGAFNTGNIEAGIIAVDNSRMKEAVVFGCDIADKKDFTVITGLNDKGESVYFERFNNKGYEFIVNRIKALPANVKKVIDGTGAGEPVYQWCIKEGIINIQNFQISSASKPLLIQKLIKAVETGKVKYNQMTADEMYVFEYKYTSTGHLKYEAMSGFHDDTVLSLALAYEGLSAAIASQSWELYYI